MPRSDLLLPLLAVLLAAPPAHARPRPLPPALARAQEASVLARQALGFYDQKQYLVAASLWRKAAELEPTAPEYPYGVGRSEQQLGRWDQAEAAYRQVLARSRPGDTYHAKATARLAEVAQARTAAPAPPPEPAPEPAAEPQAPSPTTAPPPDAPASPPALTSPPAPTSLTAPTSPTAPTPPALSSPVVAARSTATSRAPAWWALGVGAAGLVAGGTLLAWAHADQQTLDERRIDGKFARTPTFGLADAQAAQASINDRLTWGWVSAAVGVTGTALGVVLLQKSAGVQAVLLPRPGGGVELTVVQ